MQLLRLSRRMKKPLAIGASFRYTIWMPKGVRVFKKPEASDIQGVCVLCQINKQKPKPGGKYKPLCSPCDKRQHGGAVFGYKKDKKLYCEECGFVAVHRCQLDVDHIDGDPTNDDPANHKTLCANCHRLKTLLSREFGPRALRPT